MINTDINFLWGPLLISGLFVILGGYLIFNPPKDLNTPTGLNNPPISKAKLNMDTWTEVHAYLGKMMVICGSICCLVGLLLSYLIGQSELSSSKIEGLNFALVIITSYAMLIITFIYTETHMNKTFDKKGNRK